MPTLTSSATVAPAAPARYAKQLAAHLGRKLAAEPTATGYRLAFDAGRCDLVVDEPGATLTLNAAADDAGMLSRVENVVGSHLVRFGSRSELVVEWSTGNRHEAE